MAGTPTDTTARQRAADAQVTDRAEATADGHGVRVGVLSTHNSKETKAILNAVRALGHDPVWLRDENVASRIEDGTVHRTPAVDVLVNRLLLTKSDSLLEDLELAALYEDGTPTLNATAAVTDALHKFRAGAKLAAAGLPIPDAYFGRSPQTFDAWTDHLEDAAHKQTVGTNGRQMAIVSPDEAVGPTIGGEQSFVQALLDESRDRPSDLRVYVVDGEVVAAMRRYAPDGDWRTNVALGGDVEDATDDLGAEPRRLAVEAADVLDLDVAGVDLMLDGGEWYVLEVNVTAGFKGLFEATGVSVAPYIAQLAIEQGGGRVDPDAVADLASTLDDSVPDCKPTADESNGGGDDVLGYTTRVAVSGCDGAAEAVAKSDSGARRTSVDAELAGRVGAGPLVGTTSVRSGSARGTETRPLVDLDVRVSGEWRTVTASVADRTDMTYPVLLGRDLLESYKLDISRTVEE
ncbi:ATP-grasp domain-containing protein [Halobacterium rubrum]|uniref:RimK/LysX family protein n=1 Tax=Halobacterium TaxID=2239 RepID=UPI001F2CF0C6|nr:MULTISPECIES: RimK/LysX family protein [Halobacterium]MDH5020295.1 RimK/LysX family protein [Halobacterium rubrum]